MVSSFVPEASPFTCGFPAIYVSGNVRLRSFPCIRKKHILPHLQLLGKVAVTSASVNLVVRTYAACPSAPPFNQTERAPGLSSGHTGGTSYFY